MADAKKCDRCSKYYDNYGGMAFSEATPSNKYDRMNLVRADDYEGRYKRSRSSLIRRWLNGAEN